MPLEVVLASVAVVILAVVWLAVQRRIGAAPVDDALDLDRLAAFLRDAHALVGEQLREQWGGDPSTLPATLGGLITRLEDEARERGLAMSRAELRGHVASAVVAHHLANTREVEEAMREVA